MGTITLLLTLLAILALAVALVALVVAERATRTPTPKPIPAEGDVVFAPGGPRHRDTVREARRDEPSAPDAAVPAFHHMQPVSARELDRRPSLPSGFVVTPGGPRHQSHVHRVEPQHAVLGGRGGLRILNTAAGAVRELPAAEGDAKIVPALASGWITYAYWNNGTGSSITSFTTTWTVPPPPQDSSAQVIFLFNGIQNYGANYGILQPVLQWGVSAAGGGPTWMAASWYVSAAGTALHSPLVAVSPGDTLVGVMTLTGVNNVPGAPTTFDYNCVFTGLPQTSLTVQNIAELLWCNQTLEAYGIAQCGQYPDTPSTAMQAIAIQTGATTPSLSWTPVDSVRECGQHTVVVSNSSTSGQVDLFYAS